MLFIKSKSKERARVTRPWGWQMLSGPCLPKWKVGRNQIVWCSLGLKGLKPFMSRIPNPGTRTLRYCNTSVPKAFSTSYRSMKTNLTPVRGSGEGIRGQHIQAYPFHASNHHLPMDSTVADKWWKMAKLGGEVMAHQGLTRLQFLQELHRRLNQ